MKIYANYYMGPKCPYPFEKRTIEVKAYVNADAWERRKKSLETTPEVSNIRLERESGAVIHFSYDLQIQVTYLEVEDLDDLGHKLSGAYYVFSDDGTLTLSEID